MTGPALGSESLAGDPGRGSSACSASSVPSSGFPCQGLPFAASERAISQPEPLEDAAEGEDQDLQNRTVCDVRLSLRLWDP